MMSFSIDRKESESWTTAFQYGAGGERVLKYDHNSDLSLWTKTRYVFGVNDFPIKTISKSHNATDKVTHYVYGPTGLIATKEGSKTHFVLKDHQGSTRLVVDNTNLVVAAYNYRPFGGMIDNNASEPLSYKYTGHEYDEETGLHNFRARLYDEDLGRFYGVDPAGQFSSPYVGIGNNPIMYVDPDGEWVHIVVGAGVGAIVGGIQAGVRGDNVWKGIGVGAAIGALSAATGGAVTGALGGGFAATVAGGAASGAVSGGLNAGVYGGDITAGIWQGALGGAIGGMVPSIGVNGVIPGAITGAAGGALGGGLAGGTISAINGGSFGAGFAQGAKNGALGGALSGGVYGGMSAFRNYKNTLTGFDHKIGSRADLRAFYRQYSQDLIATGPGGQSSNCHNCHATPLIQAGEEAILNSTLILGNVPGTIGLLGQGSNIGFNMLIGNTPNVDSWMYVDMAALGVSAFFPPAVVVTAPYGVLRTIPQLLPKYNHVNGRIYK